MLHYLTLLGILLCGTALRLIQLDRKPLWVDEIFTALFSLGTGFDRVPLEQLIPLSDVPNLLALNPTATCPDIARTLAEQSTHPPLFFCLMHRWLVELDGLPISLTVQLRAFAVLFGVGAIALIYLLNRLAFSPQAGLIGSAIVAFSPFGVYQSQEARHYTLPVFLIALSLILLLQMGRDIEKERLRQWIWGSWAMVNAIGFYTHYFCLIAFVAQIFTLIALLYKTQFRFLLPATFFSLLPLILFSPWFPILLQHFTSPKTSWLPPPQHITPLLQTLLAMALMVVIPPVENQPLWIIIPLSACSLLFLFWAIQQILPRFKTLLSNPKTAQATFILSSFIAWTLLQFLVIVYLLQKDITSAPRYSFLYYPAFCALLGASFSQRKWNLRGKLSLRLPVSPRHPLTPSPRLLILLGISLASSLCVVFNLAFQKPYHPLTVARQLNTSPASLVMVMGYNDTLPISLGLSYALALQQIRTQKEDDFLIFLNNEKGYDRVWENISQDVRNPQNLWIFAPGLLQEQYPQQIDLNSGTQCLFDPAQYYRIGIPYQGYSCR
ncbi:glycosyltransferase family 39 protein [Lusitaniella coriacea]|uniref:glycosyltransferase family 39 protein n=1 Tax=Lusitaniella coriacea TaxID=1983105 RepID=UPI003CF274A8